MKRLLFNLVSRTIKKLLGLQYPNKFACSFIEEIDLILKVKGKCFDINIACPNRINLYRAETYFTKEPDMIEWMDTFDGNTVLIDIGSNIGLYSVYAALKGA
jgi:hypothetical protein